MYFSHIYLNVPFNYVFLSRLLYSAKGISATDILPVICLGSDVALNKSKFIIIIIIIRAKTLEAQINYIDSVLTNTEDNQLKKERQECQFLLELLGLS